MNTKTMTLNLSDKEMTSLEELSAKKGMSKTAVLRQALRVYKTVEARLDTGAKIFFEDDKKEKAELLIA